MEDPHSDYQFMRRVNEWNSRAHGRHMTAVRKWADKLAQEGRKPLPNANWWHGEPYGKRPATTVAWATKVAKKNPPEAFIALLGECDAPHESAYLDGTPPGPCRVKRATDTIDAKIQLVKLGVPSEDVEFL
jgi:hypothetical protein